MPLKRRLLFWRRNRRFYIPGEFIDRAIISENLEENFIYFFFVICRYLIGNRFYICTPTRHTTNAYVDISPPVPNAYSNETKIYIFLYSINSFRQDEQGWFTYFDDNHCNKS